MVRTFAKSDLLLIDWISSSFSLTHHEIFQFNSYLQTFSMAGLTAGVLEAILVNPFEVVKVALQANKST